MCSEYSTLRWDINVETEATQRFLNHDHDVCLVYACARCLRPGVSGDDLRHDQGIPWIGIL